MADLKITGLTALTSVASTDLVEVVDVSDTSMAATGTNKQATVANVATAVSSALGLGSMATQASSNVTITGGSVAGITDLAVADGGTGASTAADARTNLGLVIGTNVQAYDADLAAIAGVVSAADKVPYFTGSGTADVMTVTAAARTVLDDATTAAMLSTLGGISGIRVEDEGVSTVATATALNFVGSAVTVTDAGSGEATVTITGGSGGGVPPVKLPSGNYSVPGALFTGQNAGSLIANRVYYTPFYVTSTIVVTAIGFNCTTNVAASNTRCGIYADDGAFNIGALVLDSGNLDTSTTGAKTVTGLSTTLTAGWYWAAIHSDSAIGVRHQLSPSWALLDSNFAYSINGGLSFQYNRGSFSALPDPGGDWTLGETGQAYYQHRVFMAWTVS